MSIKQWPTPDQLIDWAQNKPEELERFKQREIENLIEDAPESMRRRLRGLQFQIDCKRELHSNPLASCIAISKMMLESLNELNDALHGNYEQKEPKASRVRKENNQIIPFPAAVN